MARREPYQYKGVLAMPGSDLYAALVDQDPKKAARLHVECQQREDKYMNSQPAQRWPHKFAEGVCAHCGTAEQKNWRDQSLCTVLHQRSTQ